MSEARGALPKSCQVPDPGGVGSGGVQLACPACRGELAAAPPAASPRPAGPELLPNGPPARPADAADAPTSPGEAGAHGSRYICTRCRRRYGEQDGIPLLIAATERDADAVAALYQHVAHQYDQVFRPHVVGHYLRKRVGLVRALLPSGLVLDVGCGTGLLAAQLQAAGYHVVGVDLAPAMLGAARRRGLAAVFAAHSTALPFPDGAFDLALTVATLHHLETPERVAATIGELARVVRPGGLVLLWDHNPANPYWPIIMRRVPQDHGDERLVPLRELLDDCRAAGLVVEQAFRSGLLPDFLPAALYRPWTLLERAVEATPLLSWLAAHNVVVARKP